MSKVKLTFSKRSESLTVQERRALIEEELKLDLSLLAAGDPYEEEFKGNCENCIGTVQIPVGVAGPLLFAAPEPLEVIVPLATTEAALVASVNRGCRAIALSGGLTTSIEKKGMSRAPCFLLPSVQRAKEFVAKTANLFSDMGKFVAALSSHMRLLEIKPWVFGSTVYLRFTYDTDDAMGMNMVTIMTDKLVHEYLLEEGVEYIALSGNMCVDKKPTALNFLEHRGFHGIAQVVLSHEVLKKILKTTAERILETHIRKNLMGTAAAGSMAFNSHYANILAALFAATGQDLAHVSEACMGMTTIEKREEGIVFSVTLPDLPLGTIGGGTSLPFQNLCLKMLGCAGAGGSGRFARIVTGAVLAGELSLLAALSTGHLSTAHETLRKKFPR